MPATLSTLDALLKVDYTPTPTDLTNKNAPFATQVMQLGRNDVGGQSNQIVNAFITGLNENIYFGAETAEFPTAGATDSVQASLPVRYMRGTVRLTRPAIAAFRKGDRVAFVDALDHEMQRFVEAWHIQIEQHSMFRNDGIRGSVDGLVSASAAVTLHDGQHGPGNRWFRRNMVLDGYTAFALGTEDASATGTVSVAPPSAKTSMTMTATITAEDNVFYVKDGTTSAVEDVPGLMNWLEDVNLSGTWNWFSHAGSDNDWGSSQGNVPTTSPWASASRSTYPGLNAVITHNSGTARDLTEQHIVDHFMTILDNSGLDDESSYNLTDGGGGSTQFIMLSSPQLAGAFSEEYRADRTVTQQPINVQAGISGLEFHFPNVGRVTWFTSPHVMPNCLVILDLNTWKIHISGDEAGGWVDTDGRIFRMALGTGSTHVDAIQAYYDMYWTPACFVPWRNGAIVDLNM